MKYNDGKKQQESNVQLLMKTLDQAICRIIELKKEGIFKQRWEAKEKEKQSS